MRSRVGEAACWRRVAMWKIPASLMLMVCIVASWPIYANQVFRLTAAHESVNADWSVGCATISIQASRFDGSIGAHYVFLSYSGAADCDGDQTFFGYGTIPASALQGTLNSGRMSLNIDVSTLSPDFQAFGPAPKFALRWNRTGTCVSRGTVAQRVSWKAPDGGSFDKLIESHDGVSYCAYAVGNITGPVTFLNAGTEGEISDLNDAEIAIEH